MKDKLRQLLEKIPYKIIYIVLASLMILGLCLTKTKYSLFGSALMALTVLMVLFVMLIHTMKLAIKDLKNFGIGFLIIIWFIIVIGSIGSTMIVLIPKFYPQNESVMYNLYSTAITSLMTSIIGVAGTYLGAVYGGTKANEAVEKQLKKQDELKIEKEKKDEIIAARIITKLLKEEIIDNNVKLVEQGFYNSIEKIKENHKYYVGLSQLRGIIKFDTYESIKYELIRYPSVKIVEEVIELYGLFYFLIRYENNSQFTSKENEKLFSLKSKVNGIIEQLE